MPFPVLLSCSQLTNYGRDQTWYKVYCRIRDCLMSMENWKRLQTTSGELLPWGRSKTVPITFPKVQ